MEIRPISELRNNFSKIEELVLNEDQAVYLTKNGYGSMVVMSMEKYAELTDDIEMKLDEAEMEAELTDVRYTAEEVFGRVRSEIMEEINARKKI